MQMDVVFTVIATLPAASLIMYAIDCLSEEVRLLRVHIEESSPVSTEAPTSDK